VNQLNRDVDAHERRLREEVRELRDRLAADQDELEELRGRSAGLDEEHERLRSELESVSAERDELKRTAQRATDTLASEKEHQEERYAALQAELEEANVAGSRLTNEKREVERRLQDVEKRLGAAEEAREKAEQERDREATAAARAGKELEELQARAQALEKDLAAQRQRVETDVGRLRRRESKLRADADTYRSRLRDVLGSLQSASKLLEELPKDDDEDEGEDDEPGPGPEGDDPGSRDDGS